MCKITRPLQNSHLTYNKDKIFPSFGSFLSNALGKRSRKGNRGTKPSAAGHFLLPLKLIGWTSFCLRSVIGPSSSSLVPFNSPSGIQCAASAKRHIKTLLLVCAWGRLTESGGYGKQIKSIISIFNYIIHSNNIIFPQIRTWGVCVNMTPGLLGCATRREAA